MTKITAKKVLLKDEFGNALIPYTENQGNLPVGQIISVNCSPYYVPEGTLPCDGAEYAKAQFEDLWNNYLTGEKEIIDTIQTINADLTMKLVAIPTAQATPFDAVFGFRVGDDVTTRQDFCDGVYIKDGALYGSNTAGYMELAKIKPNSSFYLKIQLNDVNLVYAFGQSKTNFGDTILSASGITSRYFNITTIDTQISILADSTINNELLYANGEFHSMVTASNITISNVDIIEEKRLLNTCGYSEYNEDLATYGQCAKFGINTENEIFRVPFIKDGAVIQQALSDDELGKAYNAGLPDITGKFAGISSDNGLQLEGAFYNTNATFNGAAKGENDKVIGFQASLSNSIYGNSDTVQPNAVALRYFVVVSNGSINESMMNWSEWVSSLQGKANTDLSNVPNNKGILVETYNNDTSWYRLYSDGWCEQGGRFIATRTATQYSLLIPFVDENYNLTISHIAYGNFDDSVMAHTLTTTSFKIQGTNRGANDGGMSLLMNWRACGYTI